MRAGGHPTVGVERADSPLRRRGSHWIRGGVPFRLRSWDVVRPLTEFLLKRVAQGMLVMFLISLVAFAVQDHLGDPLREMMGEAVSEAEREAMREELGLNDPWLRQYGRFLGRAATGRFPVSYHFKESSLRVILRKFPATLELVLTTALAVVLLSVPLGVWCARRPRNPLSMLVLGGSLVGISVPVFLIGIGLQVLATSFDPPLFGVHGRGDPEALRSLLGWKSSFLSIEGLRHLVAPCLTLSAIMCPLFIRLVRSEMLEVAPRDYVRTARAKGCGERQVWLVHALRNALLPVISVGGVQLGTLLAYTLITETVFNWQGVGWLFLEAVNRSDVPLLVTYLMFTGFLFVVVSTVVDMLYTAVNPRLRIGGGGG